LTVLPVIGELGYVISKQHLVIARDQRTFITEQFRNLRGAVSSRLSTRPGKGKGRAIMVTSSIAAEGKSFVAINLAAVFAQAGMKTVLIEADMYKPKLKSVFHLNGELGLSNILQDPDLHAVWASCIQRTAAYDNLYIIPAGNARGNPSELLLNNRFTTLMKELENDFEFIIIDSVPINPVPDAFAIGKYADITLFVVRHGVTPKENVQVLDEDMKMQELKNVNIVFNGIKRRGIATSGYGHTYGYGLHGKTGYGYYTLEEKETIFS
jgi:tyrosine-protein kinase Etk/Wzc